MTLCQSSMYVIHASLYLAVVTSQFSDLAEKQGISVEEAKVMLLCIATMQCYLTPTAIIH